MGGWERGGGGKFDGEIRKCDKIWSSALFSFNRSFLKNLKKEMSELFKK
jgi:hypothetical protein